MELVKEILGKRISGRMRRHGIFLCSECGENTEKRLDSGLRDKSCGCSQSKHLQVHGELLGLSGGKRDRLYYIWQGMRGRCFNRNNEKYHRYGARGITVCEEWNFYAAFKVWAIKNGYNDALTIDRTDNDGNYNPGNCEFIPLKDNSIKRKGVVLNYENAERIRLMAKDRAISRKEIADYFGISVSWANSIISNKAWVAQ